MTVDQERAKKRQDEAIGTSLPLLLRSGAVAGLSLALWTVRNSFSDFHRDVSNYLLAAGAFWTATYAPRLYHILRRTWKNLLMSPWMALPMGVLWATLWVALGWPLASTIVTVVTPIVMLMAISVVDDPNARQNGRTSESDSNSRDKSSLQWTKDDLPIDSKEDDRFGAVGIAERMAHRIQTAIAESTHVSLALVGPFGSGKTSIINLMRNSLPPQVVFVDVSLWPFGTISAAIEGILVEIDDALRTHGVFLSMHKTTERYIRAIEGIDSRAHAVARLLNPPVTPEQALQKLERGLQHQNISLVVVIEDMARFAANGGGTSVGFTHQDGLATLRAFLFNIHQLENVHLVMTSRTLRERFDLEKIARYIERAPRCAPQHVGFALDACKKRVLEASESGTIVPGDPGRMFDHPLMQQTSDLLSGRSSDHTSIWVAVSELLTTPRNLKQTLRLFDESWGHLKGEIDPEDLFVVCLVRTALPNLFALLDEGYAYFAGKAVNDERGRRPRFMERLDALLEAGPARKDVQQALYDALFSEGRERADKRPQSVRLDRRYWNRAVLGRVTDVTPDQPLLATMAGWEKKQNDDLLEYAMAQGLKRVRQFHHVLTVPRKAGFIEAAFHRLVERSRASGQEEQDMLPQFRKLVEAVWNGIIQGGRQRAQEPDEEKRTIESALKRAFEAPWDDVKRRCVRHFRDTITTSALKNLAAEALDEPDS